jgi:hypothetical protein
MRWSRAVSPRAAGLIVACLLLQPSSTLAQFVQQGPKLVGTFVSGSVPVEQGYSVGLSWDGDTAIVGGPYSSCCGLYTEGAAWIFTRSGGVWTQQGGSLVGNDVNESRAPVLQGYSVALSADGNTAIVGGPGDADPYVGWGSGAAWVYTRSGRVWTQQGPKLVGNGFVAYPGQGWTVPAQGWSVALSADGNTAIVGGPNDAGFPGEPGGATWVWIRAASSGRSRWQPRGVNGSSVRLRFC